MKKRLMGLFYRMRRGSGGNIHELKKSFAARKSKNGVVGSQTSTGET